MSSNWNLKSYNMKTGNKEHNIHILTNFNTILMLKISRTNYYRNCHLVGYNVVCSVYEQSFRSDVSPSSSVSKISRSWNQREQVLFLHNVSRVQRYTVWVTIAAPLVTRGSPTNNPNRPLARYTLSYPTIMQLKLTCLKQQRSYIGVFEETYFTERRYASNAWNIELYEASYRFSTLLWTNPIRLGQ